ncbi:MAG: aldo/keto reductase, partial [Chloroflexi bacterium]|nr:aldo/keto reductase [Chloroflexota bacterium]
MHATADGTRRFRERVGARVHESHFTQADGLWLSSIGLGTYLGEPDEQTSAGYEAAIARAVALGCNVVDTASNYRFQLSERTVGLALRGLPRDEIFVSSKAGYVPYDGALPKDPSAYIVSTFINTGVARAEDFTQGGQHCITPRYLAHQLAQ